MDDFGQTDFKIDLFAEIEKAYDGQESVFDRIGQDDVIIAFFPCVRFENQIMLAFRGQLDQMKNWNMKQKMLYCMKTLDELKQNYDAVNKMFIVCMDRGLKLVMENPYSKEHFLHRYWCYKPEIIDRDRRENGDYFAKPTQFWFLNMKPKNNFLMDAISYNHIAEKDAIERLNSSMYADRFGKVSLKVARSMIHPEYANRFIRRYLIAGEEQQEEVGQLKLKLE